MLLRRMRGLSLAFTLLAACATVGGPDQPSSSAAAPVAPPELRQDSGPVPAAGGPAAPTPAPTAQRSSADSRERFRRGVGAVAFEVQVHPPDRTDVAGFVLSRDGK